jgi:hypothetical protein
MGAECVQERWDVEINIVQSVALSKRSVIKFSPAYELTQLSRGSKKKLKTRSHDLAI